MDERRRRRLAQEAEQETPAERRAPARPSAAPKRPAASPRLPESPIESFIRPQFWLNALLVVFGLSVCGGLIWLGDWIDRLHPHLSAAFGLRDGLLHRFLRALSFLAGAQLAIANLWYRARSRKDFAGRYRVWHFVVPAWLLFGLATATDGHWLAAQWARDHWSLAGEHAVALCWMVPAGVCLLTLTRLLHVEMRGSRGSSVCMWLGTLAAIANAVLLLGANSLPVDERVAYLVERSAESLWPLAVLMAMVFYARHVIYVTNEPSAPLEAAAVTAKTDQPGWFARWQERRRIASEQRRAAAEKAAAERKAAAELKAQAAAKQREEKLAKKAAPKPEAAPKAAVRNSEPDDDAEDNKAIAPPPKSRPAARPEPLDEPAAHRPSVPESIEDEADDEEEDSSGRGLSRKERRRMRKLQRQQAER